MNDTTITVADAERIVAEQPFARWWGLRVEAVGAGSARLRLPFRPELTRPGGVLHGPSYEVVADVATWLAIMTLVGEEPMAVTIEMKTTFLRGASSDITCAAEIVKLGRRVVFGLATTRMPATGWSPTRA